MRIISSDENLTSYCNILEPSLGAPKKSKTILGCFTLAKYFSKLK
jgi:hypothetical protein